MQYRVCVSEWVSHVVVLEAASADEAEATGLWLWESDVERFECEDSGFDGVMAEPL